MKYSAYYTQVNTIQMLTKYQWKLHFALFLQQINLMKIKGEKELNSIYKVVVSMKWSLKE